jgi:hypothetical protein
MNEVKWNFVEKMLDIEKKFNDYSITLHSKRKEYKWYEKKMITGVNTLKNMRSECIHIRLFHKAITYNMHFTAHHIL